MSRFRIEFTKGEPVRFVSHLELAKTFERAFRRAVLPIAFSEGFNPHPKIAFASALAVGVTSEVEIVELELREDMSTEQLARSLVTEMPPGLEIKQIIPVAHKTPALMALIDRAIYKVLVEITGPLKPAVLAENINNFLALEEIKVEKFSKKGSKIINIRPGIYGLKGEILGNTVLFNLELLTGSTGSVRPDQVIEALVINRSMPLEYETMVIHRTGLAISGPNGNQAPLEAGLLG